MSKELNAINKAYPPQPLGCTIFSDIHVSESALNWFERIAGSIEDLDVFGLAPLPSVRAGPNVLSLDLGALTCLTMTGKGDCLVQVSFLTSSIENVLSIWPQMLDKLHVQYHDRSKGWLIWMFCSLMRFFLGASHA